ncbi:enkurin [Drosophila pseudoobscura]|uniref:Enkurin n=1 Tax=Drosophila pseudoobscura pseudoobscura TaxID=46245 RepID=Q29FB0_DROPS|nr:enkurin [Drosophila pseudoobscura]
MSLVYITHHDENIFDCEQEFLNQATSKPSRIYNTKTAIKGARFAKSLRDRLQVEEKKHSIMLQNDGMLILTDAKKAHHRTMGCAHTPVDPPCAYLRKNQGIKWRRENNHVCPKGEKMPPLPGLGTKRTEPIMAPNFIRRNIQCAKHTVPCPPPPRYIDTPVGTRHNLLNSGLLPQFICRKDFGKVPIYLKKTKKKLAEMNAICAKEQARLMELCRGVKGFTKTPTAAAISAARAPPEVPGMRVMDQKERNEILEGLRHSLTEMTKQYQSMSLLIDSVAKVQRKGKLESDLRQVEQDILLLETSPIIYVSLY